MTAKEKVLKIRSDAYVQNINGYQILAGGADCRVQLSHTQIHQSWAWAQAYRLLTNTKEVKT